MLSHFSCVQLFGTLRTVAHQAPLSTGFSKQEYWSGLPCPSPGDLPDPGIKLAAPEATAVQADSLPLSHLGNRQPTGISNLTYTGITLHLPPLNCFFLQLSPSPKKNSFYHPVAHVKNFEIIFDPIVLSSYIQTKSKFIGTTFKL